MDLTKPFIYKNSFDKIYEKEPFNRIRIILASIDYQTFALFAIRIANFVYFFANSVKLTFILL